VIGCGGKGREKKSPVWTTWNAPSASRMADVNRSSGAVFLDFPFKWPFARACSAWNVPSPFSSRDANSLSTVTNTDSKGSGSTSNTFISIPLRLWLVIFEGAIFCSASANPWRARDDGENCAVECARAVEGLIGTIDHVESSTEVEGLQGQIATWWNSGALEGPFPFSWANKNHLVLPILTGKS
jgi:hypothetical protein